MGQQQLLLIILGVIIVGIAIAGGLWLFSANSDQSNKDAIINDLDQLAAYAYQYYTRPEGMGGGSNSFVGVTVPTNLSSNTNGTYSFAGATLTSVEITGASSVVDGGIITITIDNNGQIGTPVITGW